MARHVDKARSGMTGYELPHTQATANLRKARGGSIALAMANHNLLTMEGSSKLWASIEGFRVVGLFRNAMEIREGLRPGREFDVLLCTRSVWLELLASPVLRTEVEKAVCSRVVIMGPDDARAAREAFSSNVAGYIPYSAGFDDLVNAARMVATGYLVFPARLAGPRDDLDRAWLTFRSQYSMQLTERELEVAYQAACGQHDKEIAGALGLSVRSVQGLIGNTLSKLGVRSRVELAILVWTGQLPAGKKSAGNATGESGPGY